MTEGSFSSSHGDTAELFNGRFLKVHRHDEQRPEPFCQVADISHPWVPVHFTTEVVGRLLREVNPYKSAGPDGVHSAMIDLLAPFLCGPIRVLCEMTVTLGVPSKWKKS